ncbi:MAG TPA: hypothetical protein VMV69_24140 [Pirellulales bacterium]|nr:hypothetical protein [Pirellulales bacterium]
MKRRTVARKPLTGNTRNDDTPAGNTPAGNTPAAAPPDAKAAEKRWEFDQPEGIAAPVIRANMISLRVSYQGTVQVAFFDHR